MNTIMMNTLIMNMMTDIPSQEENKISEKGWYVFSDLQDEKTQYFYKKRDNEDNIWKNMKISKLSKDIENNTIIVAYDKDTKEEIEKFTSQGEASRKLGVDQGTISGCIKKDHIAGEKYIFEELKNQPPLEKSFEEKLEELKKNSRTVGKTASFTLNGKKKIIRKHRLILFYIKKEKFVCKCCNKIVAQESHIDCDHIDGNHDNNNPDNLQPLCKSCHSKKTNEQTRESRKKKKEQHFL
jgi:5-methylcytosine-specific restriction endonuclease McrA